MALVSVPHLPYIDGSLRGSRMPERLGWARWGVRCPGATIADRLRSTAGSGHAPPGGPAGGTMGAPRFEKRDPGAHG